MEPKTPLTPPPHHLDLVLDAEGALVSTGPGTAEWLRSEPQALPRIRALLADAEASESAWWAASSPVHFRFVPIQADEGTRFLVTVVPTRPELLEALDLLTPAQREVAEYAAAGATVAEIASATARSPETVRSHVKAVYRRLEICTRLELQWLMRRPAISYEN